MKTKFLIDKFHFRSNSIFDGLSEGEIEKLESITIETKIKKGQTLFIEGTSPNGIYFLREGKVKKYKSNRDGKEQIIYICSNGELLGYPALICNESYSDSAAAIEDSLVGFISKNDFFEFLSSSPILTKNLLINLSHEFGVLINGIASFSYKTVRERLALSLLIMRDKYKKTNDPNEIIEINLTREDLANLVGIAVETLVRILHDFKSELLIETQGRKIRLLDISKLISIANYN